MKRLSAEDISLRRNPGERVVLGEKSTPSHVFNEIETLWPHRLAQSAEVQPSSILHRLCDVKSCVYSWSSTGL